MIPCWRCHFVIEWTFSLTEDLVNVFVNRKRQPNTFICWCRRYDCLWQIFRFCHASGSQTMVPCALICWPTAGRDWLPVAATSGDVTARSNLINPSRWSPLWWLGGRLADGGQPANDGDGDDVAGAASPLANQTRLGDIPLALPVTPTRLRFPRQQLLDQLQQPMPQTRRSCCCCHGC